MARAWYRSRAAAARPHAQRSGRDRQQQRTDLQLARPHSDLHQPAALLVEGTPTPLIGVSVFVRGGLSGTSLLLLDRPLSARASLSRRVQQGIHVRNFTNRSAISPSSRASRMSDAEIERAGARAQQHPRLGRAAWRGRHRRRRAADRGDRPEAAAARRRRRPTATSATTVLANAPDAQHGFFAVPKVIE